MRDQKHFWLQNAFLICFWRFLISNKSDQLDFKLEKLLGFRNMQEKLENEFVLLQCIEGIANFHSQILLVFTYNIGITDYSIWIK